MKSDMEHMSAVPSKQGASATDDWYGNMGLRDYFAAKAMQAMLSSDRFKTEDIPLLPKASFAVADALIAERSK